MHTFDGKGIRFSFFLSSIHPFDSVFVCLAVFACNGLHNVLSVCQGDIVYNIMYVCITLRIPDNSWPFKKLRFSDIRINGDRSDFLFAIHIPALCQVQDRIFTPVRLVPEIRVFLRLAVKSDHALHVTGGKIAAISQRSSKIESVPQIRSDNIRMLGDHAPLVFVCLRLKSFGSAEISGW